MNKIFALALMLLISGATFGQQRHVCGVSHDDQLGMIERLEDFNKRIANGTAVRSDEPVYIPVKFHLVATNDGSGRVKASEVLQQMAVMIRDYAEMNLHLYLDDEELNYIDNTSIYENPGNFVASIVSRKDNNAVNIFICENANPPGTDPGSGGVVLGFYNPGGDYVIIRNTDVNAATSSLSHELGHLFSLPHTFFGWERVFEAYGWQGGWDPGDNTFMGQVDLTRTPLSNALIELVDGSNCAATADRICDTPPDYNFGFGNAGCTFDRNIKDRNGDINEPMERNYMGYFIGCEPYIFTQGQEDAMRDDINSPARANIRRSYIPNTDVIVSNHEVVAPSSGESLEFYNQIQLEWTPAENATNYVVALTAGGGEFYEFFTQETQFTVPELTPNKFYFLEITPFNDGYTDTETVSSTFRTGTEENTTSVSESKIIQNVAVFPNPVSLGNDLNVTLSITKNTNVDVSLVDLTGTTVSTQSTTMSKGSNVLSLQTQGLASGIYIMKMDTEDGSTHKKVIIQ